MAAKTILALLFLASIVAAAGVFIRVMSREPAAAPVEVATPQPTREILVAAAALPKGRLLQSPDIRWVPTDSKTSAPGQITRQPDTQTEAKSGHQDDGLNDVIGGALRNDVAAGRSILREDLAHPGDRDFLHLLLAPGARAIAITPVPGSVLLNAGDRVDVILMQNFGNDIPIARRSVGETVVRDVRVLAIEGVAKGDSLTQPRGVIIEVSAEQAEKIVVATGLGKLLLTVRGEQRDAATPPALTTDQRAAKPIWAGDVSPALEGIAATPAQAQPSDRGMIDVVRGNKTESVKMQ